MGEKSQTTGMASEFYVLSCLYRIGAKAHLTLGQNKAVDIIVEKPDSLLTIDVKGLQDKHSSFPIDHVTKKDKNHFIVFVAFNGKFKETNYPPDIYIVPAAELPYMELDGESIIYISPKDNLKRVYLSKLRKLNDKYKDKWEPFI